MKYNLTMDQGKRNVSKDLKLKIIYQDMGLINTVSVVLVGLGFMAYQPL